MQPEKYDDGETLAESKKNEEADEGTEVIDESWNGKEGYENT